MATELSDRRDDGSGERAHDFRLHLRAYLLVLLGAVIVALFLRVFIIHAYRIPSSSMEHTLLVGDYLFAERVSYGTSVELPWSDQPLFRMRAPRRPQRGDVVIFGSWDGSEHELIKRCVALAGDTVEVANGVLLVNGAPFDSLMSCRFGDDDSAARETRRRAGGEAYPPARPFKDRLRSFGPHVVQPEHVFVVGDNRDNSIDSRMKGDLPLASLRGKPLVIYWSMEQSSRAWNPFARVRWSRIGRLVL